MVEKNVTLVRKISFLSFAAVGFAFLFHVGAYFQWRVLFFDFLPYMGFKTIFLVMLGLSFLLSIAMMTIAELYCFRIILLLKFLITIGLGQAFGPYLFIGLSLLLALLFEICIYEEFPANMVLSYTAIAVSLLPMIGLFTSEQSFGLHNDLIIYISSSGLVAFIGCLMTRQWQKTIEYRNDLVRLDRAVADLSVINKDYLQIAQRAEEMSAREERNRITRELHDSIGYTLTNLSIITVAAKALIGVDGKKLGELLDTANQQIKIGMEETKCSLYNLREKDGIHLVGITEIHKLIKTFEQATGIHVDVDYSNFPIISDEKLNSTIYHFVQEGFTNSFRHGKATRIRIQFRKIDGVAQIHLWDNGAGTDLINEGLGMQGMRERLGKLGGTFEARNVIDGFEISAEMPLKE